MIIEQDIAWLKISSGMVSEKDDSGLDVGLDFERIDSHCDEIAEVSDEFCTLVVVGGAVAAGRKYIEKMGDDYRKEDPQMLASYGAPAVSMAFQDALAKRGVKSGQGLITQDKLTAGSELMEGLITALTTNNILTINEDDLQATFELRVQAEEEKITRKKRPDIENDRLTAEGVIATIEELEKRGLGRELAVHMAIFTDVGGLKDGDEVMDEISLRDREAAYDKCNGVRLGGSGGMRVKAEACFDAKEAGAKTVHIASPEQSWLKVVKDQGEEGKVTKVVQ